MTQNGKSKSIPVRRFRAIRVCYLDVTPDRGITLSYSDDGIIEDISLDADDVLETPDWIEIETDYDVSGTTDETTRLYDEWNLEPGVSYRFLDATVKVSGLKRKIDLDKLGDALVGDIYTHQK